MKIHLTGGIVIECTPMEYAQYLFICNLQQQVIAQTLSPADAQKALDFTIALEAYVSEKTQGGQTV
ncbi:hypothetical protein [Paenibacillus naphthalenovorans]|uniref:hypothetical protein n=1 Tax=Paenibacillus naphthalenovorans TaxID=162209 RepID=UPI003D279F51